ncbi:MAG: sulfatase-like hydrolase/transferase [Solirubrobacterales bacterium]|nr:sulfatase-like hydrolase/transferase [Solirubrobacterales bacterium]
MSGGKLTRRRLLAAGAGAAGAVALGAGMRVGAADASNDHNVLLIVIDSLRPDHVGAYGPTAVRTPNIDALAAGGTRFTRVYPEAMPTMPMRRTILTGRRVFPFRDWRPWSGLGRSPGWSPIMPGTRTLIDEFRDAGYYTTYVTDNPFIGFSGALRPFRRTVDTVVSVPGHVASARRAPTGSDADARRVLPAHMLKWDHEIAGMHGFLEQNGGSDGLDIRESETGTARVFDAAITALRNVNPRRRLGIARKPFMMVVDGFDPHEPWAIPRRYWEMYGDPDETFIGDIAYGTADRLTATELERLAATYKAAVTLVDAQVGRLLTELEALGLAETTTVALVSDHGIYVGERDWVGKSAWLLNPELIHVPLIVRTPDGRAGQASDWFAQTQDIPPTLMALAGLRPPARFEGADLTPLVRGGGRMPARDFVYGGYANDFFVRDDRWALVSDNRMRGRQLYDIQADPGERRDVARDHPAVVRRMRERMLAELDAPPTFYRPPRFELEPLEMQDFVD